MDIIHPGEKPFTLQHDKGDRKNEPLEPYRISAGEFVDRVRKVRGLIEADVLPGRERSLALTKLEEAEMCLGRVPS